MSYEPHDPEKIVVRYTKDGVEKRFSCGMERLDDLIAWANKEYGNASEPVRPDTHTYSTHYPPYSTASALATSARKRKA